MMEGEWLGYLLTRNELTLLFSLAQMRPIPGVYAKSALTGEETGAACRALLKKGFLWHMEEQNGFSPVCELLLREWNAYTHALCLRGLHSTMALYQTPRLWLCLEEPSQGSIRLLPVRTALEAHDLAFAFVTQSKEHASVEAWRGSERVTALRLTQQWRDELDAVWDQLVQR